MRAAWNSSITTSSSLSPCTTYVACGSLYRRSIWIGLVGHCFLLTPSAPACATEESVVQFHQIFEGRLFDQLRPRLKAPCPVPSSSSLQLFPSLRAPLQESGATLRKCLRAAAGGAKELPPLLSVTCRNPWKSVCCTISCCMSACLRRALALRREIAKKARAA